MATTPKLPEILFGEDICEKLKGIYFPEIAWDWALAKKICAMFNQIKIECRIIFKNYSEIDMLKEISHYSLEGFRDLCVITKIERST